MIKRLGQGSTWAGIGVAAEAAANFLPGGLAVIAHCVAAAAAGVAGVLNS